MRIWIASVAVAACGVWGSEVAWSAGVVGSFGGFTSPRGVAVDQSSGNVFVVDEAAGGTVKRFDSEGVEAPFSTVQSYVAGNALTGTPAGGFAMEGFFPVGVAVDGSDGPAAGDVYVTDNEGESVWVFAEDGSFLGKMGDTGASPLAGGLICGVAVDGAGDVYVAHLTGHVDRYAPVDGTPEDDAFVSQIQSNFFSCGIAVASSGVEYVQQWSLTGTGEVLRYPGGKLVDLSGSDVTGSAVGMNLADDHVFVDRAVGIAQFDTQGKAESGLPAFGSGALINSQGVAVSAAIGRLYASDASGVVDIFAIGLPGAPSVESEAALRVAASSAELTATISSGLTTTTYTLEYGTSTGYGQSAPGGPVGEGEEGAQVGLAIGALLPGTLYHYRFRATNKYASTAGPDQTFNTPSLAAGGLPDERAWELVSPTNKNGGQVAGIDKLTAGGVVQASLDGDAITYASLASFGDDPQGAPFGSQYVSHRTAEGWSTQNITSPTRQAEYVLGGAGTAFKAFAADISSGLQWKGELPLPVGLTEKYENYWLRDTGTGSYRALITSPPHAAGEETQSAKEFKLEFSTASPDLKHIVIESPAALTSGATYQPGAETQDSNIYEWTAGIFDAVNILPGVTNGETTPEASVGLEFEKGLISDDGSLVSWTAANKLYVRERIGTPEARTVQIDVTHAKGESGNGEFMTASANGSKVFFRDRARLTADATASGFHSGEDLYEFDTENEDLTDLSVDSNPNDLEGAKVLGVLDASRDGSYVYFVAEGALPQAQSNRLSQNPVSGAQNLYVSHDHSLRYIARLDPSDLQDWNRTTYFRTSRIADDGLRAVFMSTRSLTGYDNAHYSEVYLYDFASGGLSCVSCNPTGARASGPSSIPPGTGLTVNKAIYQSRVLASDGSRVLFDSSDKLVPQDSNGRQDVYQYESGKPYLISGGTSNGDSSFVDASVDGKDIFFITGQQLTGEDQDGLFDLYDAREHGGITRPPPPITCSGTGCQGPPSAPPTFATPPTATFNGPGNYRTTKPQATKRKKSAKKKQTSRKPHTNKHKKGKKKHTKRTHQVNIKTTEGRR